MTDRPRVKIHVLRQRGLGSNPPMASTQLLRTMPALQINSVRWKNIAAERPSFGPNWP